MDPNPIPKPSDEELSRLIAQHGPARPQAYAALRPWHDLIQALRAKGASAETVRHILRSRNVQVSETSVRNFLREVLGEAPAPVPAPRRRARRGPPPGSLVEIPPSSVSETVQQPRPRGPRIANLKRNPDA